MAGGIDTEEFERWMNLLREDMRGIHMRLDVLNGRVRLLESETAVLKSNQSSNGAAAAWGGSIGGAVVGAVEAVKWVLGK